MTIQPYELVDYNSIGGLSGLGSVKAYRWTLANGDSGKPFPVPNGYDLTAHFGGTFDTNGSVTLLGSCLESDLAVEADASGGSWATVADGQGNAMTKTAAAVETVVEQPLFLAPDCTNGDVGTSIQVTLVLRQRL